MNNKESGRKIGIPGADKSVKPLTLKKPLTQDDLASRSHFEYMEKLNKARREELKDENSSNTPGQIKS